MARSFLTDSEAFLDAAKIIERSNEVAASGPKYYLACQAIELILKAFILNNGGADNELRKIGHDLSKAWSRATELGLSPIDGRVEELIEMLTPYHLDHRFRYRQTGFLTLPVSDEMCEIIGNLVAQIGPEVNRAMKAEIQAKRNFQGRA